ncbi:hypothetical protein Cch01nite_28010 [Cellulomonas chitinilytica]|uniref:DUF1778 domain-containing protein n=1 Tax=Cellulomonas chitinilytica TaxID=398759 RepID=A0A919P2G1_9CELL|nr:DUF1778 domain-containing protein [Cellulomonas chitinilytica]GIG22077.1 hypothetical protein Cch01nite_28010 [Cellulomonas chitinilytica]
MRAAPKDERIALRVTRHQKRTIDRAAEVLGRNTTDFSVQVLTERAEEVLSDRRTFAVGEAAWEQFVAALDAPARPVPALVELLQHKSVFDE